MGNFFGLDIGSSQVRVLQASPDQTGYKVDNYGVAPLVGDDVAGAVIKAIKEAGIKGSAEVNLALPESDVYTRIIETPLLSETELASSIRYEAEQYIPVSLDEVELYHQILSSSGKGMATSQDKKNMSVLLIAVPKDRLKRAIDLMDQVGLIPKSLETEMFSLQRIFADNNKSQLFILLGHKTTDLMILNKGVPTFLNSMPSGGLALTRSLASELNLSDEQADQYKKSYGLNTALLEGKVASILSPVIDGIVNQVNKAFVYVQQLGYKKLPEQIVLAGGGALLPSLSNYLVKKLNIEVVTGDPFANFKKDEHFEKLIPESGDPSLAVVTGLAVKGF